GLAFVVLLGVAGIAYAVAERWQGHDRAEDRRAIEMRLAELGGQTVRSARPLACLGDSLGDIVETACEPLLFARPDVVASAVALVAARIDLLADAHDRIRGDAVFERKLSGARRAIELDRF